MVRTEPHRDWREYMRQNAFNWLTRGEITGIPPDVLMLLGNPYLFQRERFRSLFDQYEPAGLFAIGSLGGRRIGVCEPVFGSPMAAMYLEVLAMLGAQRVLACGYVGGLLPGALIGSYGVPDRAMALDGTSRAYCSNRCIIGSDPALTAALTAELANGGALTCRGTIASIDALMLESDAMIAELQRQDCSMIDLETACVFSVAAEAGIHAAALHIVSDNPARKDIDAAAQHEASFVEQIQAAAAVLISGG